MSTENLFEEKEVARSDINGCLGEDEEVIDMEIEDALFNLDGYTGKTERKYPMEYLSECREKLLSKVKKYRAKVEDQKSQNISMQYNHRKEIENIRTFYRGIAYAPTRSGRLVKQAQCSSKTAKELLDEFGLQYSD